MSVFDNSGESVAIDKIVESVKILGNLSRDRSKGEPVTGANIMDTEKRIRREIANSNERRRMQSINAGFNSLRTLLPHHEGEKLSKAAILQQTAEYVYSLEQEKMRLLAQNCQLKRLLNQQEINENVPLKKRKTSSANESGIITTKTEQSEEAAYSSTDPLNLIPISSTQTQSTTTSSSGKQQSTTQLELLEIRAELEHERRLRIVLEEQLRQFEAHMLYSSSPQIYQTTEDGSVVFSLVQESDGSLITTENGEEVTVVEESDNIHTNVISVCTGPNETTLVQVPFEHTAVISNTSPSSQPESRSQSPQLNPQQLPSALEAAIKAEPKVEVEKLPSPLPQTATILHDEISGSASNGPNTGSKISTTHKKLYLPNTSRQNLETIVEAIRHLEGDHLFSEEPNGKQRAVLTSKSNGIVAVSSTAVSPTQEVPLALTTKQPSCVVEPATTRLLRVEMNPFLQFHTSANNASTMVQQQQQTRPGVIVVKQHS